MIIKIKNLFAQHIYDSVEAELTKQKFECDHLEDFVIYKSTMSNGQFRYTGMCYSCGFNTAIKAKIAIKRGYSIADLDKLSERRRRVKDSVLYRYQWEVVKLFHKHYIYENYLLTSFWKVKRNQRMLMDNNTCQHCGSEARDVHHLHYDNKYDEQMEDLVSLCRQCHKKEHSK